MLPHSVSIGVFICLGRHRWILLSSVEAPNELDTNDAIAATRFVDETVDLVEWIQDLEEIPAFCLNYALNTTVVDQDENITLFHVVEGTFGNLSDPDIVNVTSQFVGDLPDLVDECEQFFEEIIDPFIELFNQSDLSLSNQEMTFFWTRCWNKTEYGDLKWMYINDAALDAVQEQEEFYIQTAGPETSTCRRLFELCGQYYQYFFFVSY